MAARTGFPGARPVRGPLGLAFPPPSWRATVPNERHAVDPAARDRLRLLADEEGPLAAARARVDGHGDPPSPEVGALLSWVATTAVARHVVEVGCAGGLSGLWLFRGMEDRAVLTSIEPDPHTHGLAGTAFTSAGAQDQVRSILGEPATVLPRLSDGSYEVVVLQVATRAYPDLLEHALRLLKPGGVLVARLPDPAGGGPDDEVGLRTFLEDLAEDARVAVTALPLDHGVVLASLR